MENAPGQQPEPARQRTATSGCPGRDAAALVSGREMAAFAAAAVGLRLILLAVDAHPRFFLGDSASYLETAFGYWIPPDRSWMYGLAVNAVFRATHRFLAVIALQSLLSAAACAGAAALLRWLGVRRGLAWAVLVLLSLDPMLLYYDRSFMTDTPGAAAAWLGTALAVAAVVEGGAQRWAVAVVCLAGAITLRTALLPVVMLIPAFALVARAVLGWRAHTRGRALLQRLAGPACFAAGVVASLAAYAIATGKVTHSKPQLNPKSGYFLLGTVAPIVRPVDFQGLGIRDPEALLRGTRHEQIATRNAQIYVEGGLLLRLEKESGSWQETSRLGRRVAWRAIRRDPLGYGRLVLATGREYFLARSYLGGSFAGGLGLDRLPDGLVDSLRRKVRDPVDAATPAQPSPVLSWMWGWSHLLPAVAWLGLFAPLLALLPVRRTAPARIALLLLASSTWVHLLSIAAFTTDFIQRYLLPLSPLVLTMLAIEADRWASWVTNRRRRGTRREPAAP